MKTKQKIKNGIKWNEVNLKKNTERDMKEQPSREVKVHFKITLKVLYYVPALLINHLTNLLEYPKSTLSPSLEQDSFFIFHKEKP